MQKISIQAAKEQIKQKEVDFHNLTFLIRIDKAILHKVLSMPCTPEERKSVFNLPCDFSEPVITKDSKLNDSF